jgi:hypothetical protein
MITARLEAGSHQVRSRLQPDPMTQEGRRPHVRQQSRQQTDAREAGAPYGTRTRVSAVKGRCPRPLDEGRGAARHIESFAKGSKRADAPQFSQPVRSWRIF